MTTTIMTNKSNSMKYIKCIIIFSISFFLVNCIDVNDFKYPDADISSIKVVTNKSCSIGIRIQKGVGYNIKESFIEFKDLTDTTRAPLKQSFNLKKDEIFTDTLHVILPISNHDYKMTLKLITEKNTFASTPKPIYFSKTYINYEDISFIDLYHSEYDYMYYDSEQNVGYVSNRGGFFLLILNYVMMPPSNGTYQLKLNGTIPLELSTSFNGSSDNTVGWGVTLPNEVTPGDYTVHLYANGKEFIAPTKLRVLSGVLNSYIIPKSPIYNSNEAYELNSYYISKNKLYYFYRYPHHAVLSYDILTKKWENKKDKSYNDDYTAYSHFEFSNSTYNNKQYFTERMINYYVYSLSSTNIVEYDEDADSWKLTSKYPGEADENIRQFVVGDCLYIGGGFENLSSNTRTEFWEYNFIQNKWTKKSNIPLFTNETLLASCNSPTAGYAITNYRNLLKYNPQKDEWTKLTSLKIGPYSRYTTTLHYGNNKLYVVGGTPVSSLDLDSKDISEYDIQTDKWKLKYLSKTGIGSDPSFYNDNKIIIGFRAFYFNEPFIDEVTL